MSSTIQRVIALSSITIALLTTASCSTIGPSKLVASHEGYNDAVQLAQTREMLLNLVRIRFNEPTQYLAVTSINASFSVSANVGWEGWEALGSEAQTNVGYSDSPTLTFTPRGDSDFIKGLFAPINFNQAVMLLLDNSGYAEDRFRLLVTGINEAADVPGPAGELYEKRVEAISKLGREFGHWGMTSLYDDLSIPMPKENVRPRDHIRAAKEGYRFVEVGNGEQVMLAADYLTPVLVLVDPKNEAVKGHLQTLGLEPGHFEYVLRPASDIKPNGRGKRAIFLNIRSLNEVMIILAKHIDVPLALERAGIVPPLELLPIASRARIPFRIHSSSTPPNSRYSIEHRGHWFYIDPSDGYSRGVLDLLNHYFVGQIDTNKRDRGPVLTLPLVQ